MTRASRSPNTARAGALLACTLLALATTASAQSSFNWVVADSSRGTALNVTSSFHTDIHNTGSVADTYRITMASSMPATWVTTMCDVGLCYPPFITQVQYTVQPGASTYLGVNITPMVDLGHGTTWITVESTNAPSLRQTVGFEVQSPATSPVPQPAAGLRLTAAPNPFNPRTTLSVNGGALPAGPLALDVFDLRGHRVRALWQGEAGDMQREIAWDGADDAGRALPGGTYVARLSGPGGGVTAVKLVLAK